MTLAELSRIDLSTARPDVQLLIQQAMSQAKVVNDAIDQAARRRTAEITVSLYDSMSGTGRNGTPRAAVGQHYGADGGLYGVGNEGDSLYLARKFANGGLNRLPDEARIEPGRGAGLVQWAEGETGGEAFIPLSPSKRARSTAILADVADRFGLKLTAYADGGIRSLRDFVDGRIGGASRPLTGAPYVWGGVNWGDCSGAMSAIARFAVGLAPFAARFATGTMAGALSAMGFLSGRGGPGDLRFGWYNGGPYGGHTAGTLPDGTNVEMGGQYGGGMVGGSTGSNSPEFTDHAYLPIGGGYDWSDPGGYAAGGRGGSPGPAAAGSVPSGPTSSSLISRTRRSRCVRLRRRAARSRRRSRRVRRPKQISNRRTRRSNSRSRKSLTFRRRRTTSRAGSRTVLPRRRRRCLDCSPTRNRTHRRAARGRCGERATQRGLRRPLLVANRTREG
ncbi:hypothetical protein GS491_23815 [Rhodococcus hoagii]|nr:hypothetical protein [Prescottella equi]